MAILNRFQTYSQHENTVTNNVLLMFSEVYRLNARYYEEYINSLLEDNELYKIIPDFKQQVGNLGNGIIDGAISTPSTKIIIETKLHGLEWVDKLLKYTDSFKGIEIKILFHLSSNKYEQSTIDEIKTKLLSVEDGHTIRFLTITYEDLVSQLNELYKLHTFDVQLLALSNDFEAYCQSSNLLPLNKNVLRAMACGQSYELNIKHQFYFDLASRGYSNFNYLGIYKNKAVQYIARIENNIEADWDEVNGLSIKWSSSAVTENQKERLIVAIKESLDEEWYIDKDHRFFLLQDFTKTHFEKTSPGGIFRVRFFNLEDYIGKEIPKEITEIARLLENQTWE